MKPIILSKEEGQGKLNKITLSKEQSKKDFEGRIKWDMGIIDADADIWAIIHMKNGNKDVIYYKNLESSCKSVRLSGDNRDGSGDGWDEIMYLYGSKFPNDVTKIELVVDIYTEGVTFNMVEKLEVELFDVSTQQPIISFEPGVTNEFDGCLVIAEINVGEDGKLTVINKSEGSADITTVLRDRGISFE